MWMLCLVHSAKLFNAYGVVAQTSLMIFTCLVVRHCHVALSVFVLEKNKATFLQIPLLLTSLTAEVKGYVEPHVVQGTLRRRGAHNSALFSDVGDLRSQYKVCALRFPLPVASYFLS